MELKNTGFPWFLPFDLNNKIIFHQFTRLSKSLATLVSPNVWIKVGMWLCPLLKSIQNSFEATSMLVAKATLISSFIPCFSHSSSSLLLFGQVETHLLVHFIPQSSASVSST